ncbi:hypothetical protein ACQ4PT_041777 [Festuca glaucescens]
MVMFMFIGGFIEIWIYLFLRVENFIILYISSVGHMFDPTQEDHTEFHNSHVCFKDYFHQIHNWQIFLTSPCKIFNMVLLFPHEAYYLMKYTVYYVQRLIDINSLMYRHETNTEFETPSIISDLDYF